MWSLSRSSSVLVSEPPQSSSGGREPVRKAWCFRSADRSWEIKIVARNGAEPMDSPKLGKGIRIPVDVQSRGAVKDLRLRGPKGPGSDGIVETKKVARTGTAVQPLDFKRHEIRRHAAQICPELVDPIPVADVVRKGVGIDFEPHEIGLLL